MKKFISFLTMLCSPRVGSQKDESRTRLRLVFDSFTCRLRVCPLKLMAVFAILLTLGVGNVWGAEEIAYTLTAAATGSNSSPHNSYGEAATGWSCTDANDVTISWAVIGNSYMVPWRIGVKRSTTAGSNTRYIYSETAISQNITKVIVTHGVKSGFTDVSVTLRVYSTAAKAATGEDGDISNVSVAYADNTTMTFNRPTGHNWTGRFYRIDYDLTWNKKNDPQYILFSSAVFKYESASCTENPSIGDASINGSFF